MTNTMQKMKANFARNFKSARQQSGIPIRAFADLVGTTYVSINLWEHGKAFPKDHYIPIIAEVLQVNENWLLGLENEPNEVSHSPIPAVNTPNIDSWIRDMMQADEEKQKAMKKIWFSIRNL